MIGKRIKKIREEKKMTQGQLAEKLGISRQAICMWEANKRELRVSTLHKVGKLLGVSIEELMRCENGAEKKRRGEMAKKAKPKVRKEIFEIAAPQAKRVVITGDFSSWQEKGITMKKSKNGLWKTEISLTPGRYEYKFIVDGQWINDPGNSNTAYNEFGTLNSVKEVAIS